MHEAQLHEAASFLTLTFDDAHLPADYSIKVRDVQLFNKRLAKRLGPFRFFACGEYGDQGGRPHYHILVFGHDFAHDRYAWRLSPSGHTLYRSPTLESLWTEGNSEIGTVTQESAQYVARYIMKKVNGKMAADHYSRVHPLTGEVCQVHPEFITMSRGGRTGKGGLGTGWYDRFQGDAFPSDFVIVNGEKRPVPRFYKKKLHAQAEADKATARTELKLQAKRAKHALSDRANNTPERLATREELQSLRLEQLKRNL